MALKSINPYTNRVIEEFEEFPDEILNEKMIRSAETFETWKYSEAGLRKSLMHEVARLLRENAGEYAGSITEEMGKPITESKAEIEKCGWACEYYANNSADFLKSEYCKNGCN